MNSPDFRTPFVVRQQRECMIQHTPIDARVYDYTMPAERDEEPLAAGWIVCAAVTGTAIVVGLVLTAILYAPDVWHGIMWLGGLL